MTSLVSRVFNFVRGAVRGLNGYEDFSNINFLIVGTEGLAADLFQHLSSAPEASVYITPDPSLGLRGYVRMLSRYHSVDYYNGEECIDIVIDTIQQEIRIKDKRVPFRTLHEDSYTQGIHEFYL